MNKDCPDAKPDKMPDDADDELREAFADADSMAHSGYTREQIWDATGIDYGPTPNGDSPTAADTIRQARAHERTAEKPHSATARFAHRRAAAHRQALQDAEITNSASTLEQPEKEPPLNDGELAALRALGAELNPAQIAADAEYMAGEMLGAVRPNGKKVVTNKCTVDNAPERCRCKGKLQRKPAQTASERAQRTAEMEAAGMSDDEIYAEQRQYLLDDSTMREVVDYKHRRSAEIRRLRDKFQNKKVERQDKKLPVIEITKKGIKEMTTDKALDKSVRMGCSVREHEEAVNRVDELLRDGIVTETRDGGQGRHAASDHVLKVSTLKSSYKSTESGELCTAVFSVHEEKDSPPYAYFMYAKKERPKQ